jgi:hypothetical protein
MPSSAKSVLSIIEQNRKRFEADVDYAKSWKAMDRARLAAATDDLREKTAILVSDYVFRRNMTLVKITKGSLGTETEKALALRGKDSVGVFREVSSCIGTIGKIMADCGFDKVLDRHIEALCQHLNYNPRVRTLVHEIREMGVTEAEISCVLEELGESDYNLLKYGGADGTLAGFVRYADSLNAPLQAEQELLEKHGLTTIQGASRASRRTIFMVVSIVAAVGAAVLVASGVGASAGAGVVVVLV